MRFVLGACMLLVPQVTVASVVISEVAWMGSSESANHEWIELHNTGSDVVVDGWILHDANNLTIDLAGTISAGRRVVLERTSDASAAGTAFLIYTGALSNTGATLVLRDQSGNVVDQVHAGENWENIGGDNTTKETAQLQNGTWYTAVATPGSAPDIQNTVVENEAEQVNTNTGGGNVMRSSVSTQSTELVLPDITLQLNIDAPNTVYVGQPFKLDVDPSGVGKTITDSLTYKWSFGNGDMRFGKETDYTFHYPGQYVVVVAGEYKRQKQFARQTVTVLPVQLELVVSKQHSSYLLRNVSDVEIDIGGYRLVGSDEHVFPKHTILLPYSEVVVPVGIVHSGHTVAALYDKQQKSVAIHVPGLASDAEVRQSLSNNVVTRAAATPPPTTQPALPSNNFGFASDVPEPVAVKTQTFTQNAETQIPQVAAAASASNNPLQKNWPTYALISLLILGTIGIYLVPQKKDDPPWV